MAFEYIAKSDNGTVRLTADAVTLHAGSPTPEQAVALRISRSVTLYVPLDRVEEVVAGIRDAARQAAGQTTHAAPHPDSGLTACCRKTPFELPRTDLMTTQPETVTCHQVAGRPAAGQPDTQQQPQLTDAERAFLNWALDQAAHVMAAGGAQFDDDGHTSMARLRRIADEAAR